MIFDLKHKKPKEVYCIYNTSFFASAENFVDIGLDEFWTKTKFTDKKNDKWIQIVNEKTRNFYMMSQYDEDHRNLSKTKYQSLIKNYSSMDFQSLNMLSSRLSRNQQLKEFVHLIDPMLVSFKGHNVFSIFGDQHEKILNFILLSMLNQAS